MINGHPKGLMVIYIHVNYPESSVLVEPTEEPPPLANGKPIFARPLRVFADASPEGTFP